MIRSRKITIKDIAREANVSIATVSRVINDPDGAKVSAPVRQQVEEVIAKWNYHPNSFARNLVCGTSHIIGCQILSIQRSELSAEVIDGIDAYAFRHDYRIVLGVSDWDEEREFNSLNAMLEKGVDGIVWFPINPLSEWSDKIIRKIKDLNCPLVCFGKKISDDIPSVNGNNRLGGFLATRHVYELGRRKIIFVGNLRDPHSRERFEGYQDFMKKNGLAGEILPSNHDRQEAMTASLARLDSGNVPEAFVCASDYIASGVYQAMAQKKLKAGIDCAVIGYDDKEFAAFLSPPLTSVDPNSKKIGGQVVQSLVKLLNGSQVRSIDIDPVLVIRNSCGEDSFDCH